MESYFLLRTLYNHNSKDIFEFPRAWGNITIKIRFRLDDYKMLKNVFGVLVMYNSCQLRTFKHFCSFHGCIGEKIKKNQGWNVDNFDQRSSICDTGLPGYG